MRQEEAKFGEMAQTCGQIEQREAVSMTLKLFQKIVKHSHTRAHKQKTSVRF